MGNALGIGKKRMETEVKGGKGKERKKPLMQSSRSLWRKGREGQGKRRGGRMAAPRRSNEGVEMKRKGAD